MTTEANERIEISVEDRERYPVPGDSAFQGEDDGEKRDFIVSADLAIRLEHLRRRYDVKFGHLADLRIECLWKRSGGYSKGKPRFGDVARVSPIMQAVLSDVSERIEWVIWLAADHAAAAGWTRRQVDAALFHLLSHLAATDRGSIAATGHDFEGFYDELEEFGPDAVSREAIGRMRQLRLFRDGG